VLHLSLTVNLNKKREKNSLKNTSVAEFFILLKKFFFNDFFFDDVG